MDFPRKAIYPGKCKTPFFTPLHKEAIRRHRANPQRLHRKETAANWKSLPRARYEQRVQSDCGLVHPNVSFLSFFFFILGSGEPPDSFPPVPLPSQPPPGPMLPPDGLGRACRSPTSSFLQGVQPSSQTTSPLLLLETYTHLFQS